MGPVLRIGTKGGLFDTFRRHFAVLTKFIRNDVKSRRYWLRGGNLRGPAPGRAPGGTDRARRVGAGPTPPPSPSTPGPRTPPTPGPVGLPGPASLGASGVLLEQLGAGCRVTGWVYPCTRDPYTRPWYLPGPVCTPLAHPVLHARAPWNTRFEHPVGEPRGMRTHSRFRVPDWFIQPRRFLHGRLTGLY